MEEERRYPVGIQTFSRIRREGYVYIDKTDLMWRMTRVSPFIFLSRPRRFGKSLLATTLCSFFRGERELFEGLKVMEFEKEWKRHPVLHIDVSKAKGQESKEDLRQALMRQLKPLTSLYGIEPEETTPGAVFDGLIQRAFKQTGEQVVVVIDEYDAPMLDVLHEEEHLPAFRHVMQEFYQCLKANEAMIRFCFITGITKFSQLSIFSTQNNITNISLDPNFSAICGITGEEIDEQMHPDVARLAKEYGVTYEEMRQVLRDTYDGYRFSRKSPDIYNPFSLMKAFNQCDLQNWWFESGTPSYLLRQMRRFHTDITKMDDIEVPSSAFDQPTENMLDALPLLYQSGYLTIKDYDFFGRIYTLGIPNQEVRVGFTEGLLPTVAGIRGSDVQAGFALRFWRALHTNDTDLALRELRAYLEGLPYVEGFKKKLEEVTVAEGFYEWTFYLIFSMLNVYVQTQVKCARGRADMVVFMPDTIYVMELKLNGTAQDALDQINDKGYALRYATDPRPVVKVGMGFSIEKRALTDYLIVED
ncbi:MAG: ATP-binding protein [Prevotella sp.]|nr:ATP-binding protein [Prevotella sp.]MBR7053954.1 ATP-binding protein [Prevotella sp.]